VTVGGVALIVIGFVGLGVAAILFGHSTAERTQRGAKVRLAPGQTFSWRGAAGIGLACAGILLLGALPAMVPALERTWAGEVLAAVKQDQLNEADEDAERANYYQGLDVIHHEEGFAFLRAGAQLGGTGERNAPGRHTNDFMLYDGVPNISLTFEGKRISSNQWGMRDRPYEKAKPPGVFRIALLGSSHEQGNGVGDDETFKYLLEEHLNRDDRGPAIRKYEILNFAVAAHGAIQKLLMLENLGFDFAPDAVFFVTYAPEYERTWDHLAKVLRAGYAIPEPYRDPILRAYRQAGVDPSMSEERIQHLLKPYLPELMGFVFERLAKQCRERGIQAYVVYRPQARETPRNRAKLRMRQQLLDLARAADLPIIDLYAAFDGVADRRSLMLDPTVSYSHTSPLGHRLLAEELYKQLHDQEGKLILTRGIGAPAR